LLSVPTLATEGYTTIFHAWNVGVDVYNAKKVANTAKAKPVLQGGKKARAYGEWNVVQMQTRTTEETLSQQTTYMTNHPYQW
jgi:hypothetical protein